LIEAVYRPLSRFDPQKTMKIGILSDVHGHETRLLAALELLTLHGAQAVVVCGDLGSSVVLRVLAESGLPAHAVAGNMDRPLVDLDRLAAEAGVRFDWQSLDVDLPRARRLSVTHGHTHLLADLIDSQAYAYVCHGHTHRLADHRVGRTRVINPGALHHPRQPPYPTVALLDTAYDKLEILRVES